MGTVYLRNQLADRVRDMKLSVNSIVEDWLEAKAMTEFSLVQVVESFNEMNKTKDITDRLSALEKQVTSLLNTFYAGKTDKPVF